MSLALSNDHHGSAAMRGARRRSWLFHGGTALVGVLVMFWTLLPVYNMLLIAFSNDPEQFELTLWLQEVSFEGFEMIFTGGHWFLEDFWTQFGNSCIIGFGTMALTVVIGSLASFAIGRMGVRRGWMIGNASLIMYAIPSSFLVIPVAALMSV